MKREAFHLTDFVCMYRARVEKMKYAHHHTSIFLAKGLLLVSLFFQYCGKFAQEAVLAERFSTTLEEEERMTLRS